MPEFKTLNNQLGETVYKELEKHIRKGSKVSTISAYFTMYAYSALKKELDKIDEIYRWYLEGKKGNEKFKDFADIYHELYVEVGCEIFQNFLNKGKTPKQILKIMNEDITREDYEFWIKNDLISDKNVEAKLYTEDEIKEKIENEGFRQKEEKSLSGLSIIGC